ncbi:uncharacterized protein LACBIDRAFT_325999 [Laccaria bicolor S238N-H82]|uniref:Predicted protein n=1 Tax=Laccaria bicolor (strain S238N-H82 / ATCC MYA-4686) TaxID=486041 RepID=B0D6Y9_LACBS|nr:uncharacterized protein LACBIDRAFT_325999 [Laccaria bicolor S238N-H82]EDR09558.1 predicted protein [Laccaria bicolor S238N-H82]|eukprot:XP_001879907.1 predicted protein [Laccaria bicolor S238N-H82]
MAPLSITSPLPVAQCYMANQPSQDIKDHQLSQPIHLLAPYPTLWRYNFAERTVPRLSLLVQQATTRRYGEYDQGLDTIPSSGGVVPGADTVYVYFFTPYPIFSLNSL